MEDEDLDCVAKIEPSSIVDSKSSSVPDVKEINKIISTENDVDGPSEELCEKNLGNKLNSVSNHEESASGVGTKDNKVCLELTSTTATSPEKVNGEIDLSESVKSDEETHTCKENKKTDDVSPNEILVSGLDNTNKRKRSSSEGSDEFYHSDDDAENQTSTGSSPVGFRGFKKRKVSEVEKEKADSEGIDNKLNEEEMNVTNEPVKPKVVELRRSARNANMAKKKNIELPV